MTSQSTFERLKVGIVGVSERTASEAQLALGTRWPDFEAVVINPDKPNPNLWSDVNVLLVGNGNSSLTQQVSRTRVHTDCILFAISEQPSSDERTAIFEAGADDYLFTPIDAHYFVWKISAILRRATKDQQTEWIYFGPLRLESKTYAVTYQTTEIYLTPTEFKLLCCLASGHGRLVTHAQLIHAIWEPDSVDYVRTLRKYVHRLRSKLMSSIGSDLEIQAVPRVGYRLRLNTELDLRRIS